MKIGVVGGLGNLGKSIVEEGQNLNNEMYIIENTVELEKSECEVYIDCTNKEAFFKNYEIYLLKQKPIVIATTGFDSKDNKKIMNMSLKIQVIKVTNFCIGAYKYLKLINYATKLYGLDYDISIIDRHQKFKKDKISGTAYNIEKSIHNVIPEKQIEFSSVRAGGIVAEHETLFVNNDNEQISISHKIFNRKTFANGALKAAVWIKNKDIGMYTLEDMF